MGLKVIFIAAFSKESILKNEPERDFETRESGALIEE